MFMRKMIAYCGPDCEKCDVCPATQNCPLIGSVAANTSDVLKNLKGLAKNRQSFHFIRINLKKEKIMESEVKTAQDLERIITKAHEAQAIYAAFRRVLEKQGFV